MYFSWNSILIAWLATHGQTGNVPVTLSGSPASMARQHRVAVESGYTFFRTPAAVRRAVQSGTLVQLRSGRHLTVKDPREGAALREVQHFLESLSTQVHAQCRESLVVTSLTRPLTRQPPNAHPLSVHPAGMAIDLRVPRRRRCEMWLERTLLHLERAGVLDATREHSPEHLHVALFPGPYSSYAGLGRTDSPSTVPPSAGRRPVIVVIPATTPTAASIRG